MIETTDLDRPQNARYIGTRTSSGTSVLVQSTRGTTPLEPRLDLVRHLPIGFDWASGSASGSAQLALALLAHASGDDDFALRNYQAFNHEIVSRLPQFRWELNSNLVLQQLRFINAIEESTDCSVSNSRKVAIIECSVPGEHRENQIQVQGCGRSVRTAATRALLNLLGNKRLRRRRIVQLPIELSVVNASELHTDCFRSGQP